MIDGPDREVRESLETIADERLRIIEKPVNEGCTAARLTGIHEARAEWIAHLDDDDEWLPQKLEQQLAIAQNSRYPFPIVSCYVKVIFPEWVETFPRRLPSPNEHLSEYLFVRHSPFYGDALIQSSTIFASRELFLKVPYIGDLHDDWGWMLKAVNQEGVGIEFAPEVLSIWNLEANRFSMSRSFKWKESLQWIRANRDLITRPAYSAFLLTEVASRAAAAGVWGQLFPLLWEAIRLGQPRLKDITTYLGMWFIQPSLRSWLRSQLLRKRQTMATTVQKS